MTYLNLIDDFIKSEKDRYPRSIIDYFWNKLINEYGFKQNNHEFHPQLFSGNLWITFSFAANVVKFELKEKLVNKEIYSCHIPQNDQEFEFIWEDLQKLL